MAHFEILNHENQKMIKATLSGGAIKAESGALHYWRGDITMRSSRLDAGGFLRSTLSGENVFRPTYSGTGEIFIGPPYFGEFAILQLEEGHPGWVLDRGAYVCSDEGVEVTIYQNSTMNALLGGEGLFQTLVRGQGQVVIRAPGTIQAADLQGDTLAVDGSFAVAREASLQYEVRRATTSLVGSFTSGEGLLQFMSGHGRVLLAPVPDLQQAMIDAIKRPMLTTAQPFGGNQMLTRVVSIGLTLFFFGVILFILLIAMMCG